jgi:ribosomal-protein-alanine N-acetyltransferase
MAAIYAAAFPDSRAWSEAEIEGMLASGRVLAVVRPDGFALVQVVGPEAELLTIAVRPAAQGQGLGAAILSEVMALAAARGAETLFLEVDVENAPARRLYARAGFGQTGLRKNYYRHRDGHRSDAVLLSCRLGA